MNLQELAELEGTKLIDTCSFQEVGGKLIREFLYDGELPLSEIPAGEFSTCVGYFNKGCDLMLKPDFYSISEVADEMKPLLECVNESIKFHKEAQEFKKIKYEQRHMRSRAKKLLELARAYQEDKNPALTKQNFHQLQAIERSGNRLRYLVTQKDIRDSFDEKQKEKYKKFLAHFLVMSEEHYLTRDYSVFFKNIEHRNPCDFHTDEKIMSTALVLAQREPVVVISNDSDIARMFKCYNGTSSLIFGFPLNSLHLYSNLREDEGYISIERIHPIHSSAIISL